MKTKYFNIIAIIIITGMLIVAGFLTSCGTTPHETKKETSKMATTTDEHDHEAETEAGHDHETEVEASTHQHKHITIEPGLIKQWGITYGSPESRDYIETVSLTGVIKQNVETTYIIHALVPGTVTAIRKDISETVSKGDVLCVLNSPGLLELKTRYIKAYQEFLQNREDFERAKNLFKINALEKKQMTSRESDYKISLAEFLSLEAGLTTIGYDNNTLEGLKKALQNNDVEKIKSFLSPFYHILSPGTGKVMMRELNLGGRVTDDQEIFEISDTRTVWAILDAMEKDLQYIDKNVPIVIESDVYPGIRFQGKVLTLMEKIDPALRSVKVRVGVENPGGLLKPEMYVRGLIEKKEKKEFLAVPAGAIVKISGMDGVFAIHDHEFAFQPVEIIARDSAGYVFVNGLKPDDQVVISGAFYLKAEYEIQGSKTDPHAGHNH